MLLGPNGKPISSSQFTNKKADPPKLGEAFGNWADNDVKYMTLPGGGVVQFDLSKLTLDDYAGMRDHYQVNASLAVLSFMQHQSDWHIECDDPKIADEAERQLRNIWTQLNRSMSTANWAGFSPNVLQWENNMQLKAVEINKIKDMSPLISSVNWKEVEGWAPPGRSKPKFKVYDGIKLQGAGWPVPVENSFWYPLLMENGDYYGKKLLRPAFTSWFFSLLVHLFANRYYERFGEPTPIGRAPYEDQISIGTDADGKQILVRGDELMLQMLGRLRSRGVVVLPNDRVDVGGGRSEYEYDLEYLESQMRGADFERYMTRLDEEISIGLFTPILLLRTADVGSYNLGVGHMQMYLWMLNAMNDDRKQYIDKYILRKIVDYNFSPNAPDAKIVFRKLGNANAELVQALLVALINKDIAKPDINELGQIAGMTIEEIKQTTAPAPDPNAAPQTQPDQGGNVPPPGEGGAPAASLASRYGQVAATVTEIVDRVRPQVENAFREHRFDVGLQLSMGYKRKFERALDAHGISGSVTKANEFYGRMDNWLAQVVAFGEAEFSSPESFMALFERKLISEVARVADVS